ncbi:hypothetical protein Nos7107_5141 [Nostoc sp. PCC 7107]|nr:hypothetical protein Nos7107_5141 [Nostoc sp. PCC 7107]
MVVWVFAGGGEAEVRGLIPFLERTFPGCKFERKTPVYQKPGPKPNKVNSYGRTGKSLIEQIKRELPTALKYTPNECTLILVFDDLDCRNPNEQKENILAEISIIPDCNNINKFVGFASPELEACILADWNNSVAKHPDFKGRHERMRWWLSKQKNIPFDNPESFSEYDPKRGCCQEKLSQALVDSSVLDEFDSSSTRFSKGLHTPELLSYINSNEVQKRCPLFRELYNYLNNLCNSASS